MRCIAARCRRCLALASRRLTDLVSPVSYRVIVGHVTAAVLNSAREFLFTSQSDVVDYAMWLKITLAVRFELWREAELGVQAVWAVSDTTVFDRESLGCAVRHTDISENCLTNDTFEQSVDR